MDKTISKSKILKAIENENLKPGNFVEGYGYYSEIKEDTKCWVCAVGAILRAAGCKNKNIKDVAISLTHGDSSLPEDTSRKLVNEQVKRLLFNERYLNALSVKFEYESYSKGVNKRLRNELKWFVEKNFPNK